MLRVSRSCLLALCLLVPGLGYGAALVLDEALPAYRPSQILEAQAVTSVGSDTMNNLMSLWSEAFQAYRAAIGISKSHYGVTLDLGRAMLALGHFRAAEVLLTFAWHDRPEREVAPAFRCENEKEREAAARGKRKRTNRGVANLSRGERNVVKSSCLGNLKQEMIR